MEPETKKMSDMNDHVQMLTLWNVDPKVSHRIRNTGFQYFKCFSGNKELRFKHNLDFATAIRKHFKYRDYGGEFVIDGRRFSITLEDIMYITGLPVDGKPIPNRSQDEANAPTCQALLGIEPPNGQLNLTWLRENFGAVHLPSDANFTDIDRHARAYILYVIGCIIFPMARNRVSENFLFCVEDIDAINTYAWGAVLLAVILHSLSQTNTKTFCGYFLSLVIFFLERVPSLELDLHNEVHSKIKERTLSSFPLMAAWATVLYKPCHNNHHRFLDIQRLYGLDDAKVVDRPYKDIDIPESYKKNRFIHLSRTIVIALNKTSFNRPDLAPHQFGVKDMRKLNEMEYLEFGKKAKKAATATDLWRERDTLIKLSPEDELIYKSFILALQNDDGDDDEEHQNEVGIQDPSGSPSEDVVRENRMGLHLPVLSASPTVSVPVTETASDVNLDKTARLINPQSRYTPECNQNRKKQCYQKQKKKQRVQDVNCEDASPTATSHVQCEDVQHTVRLLRSGRLENLNGHRSSVPDHLLNPGLAKNERMDQLTHVDQSTPGHPKAQKQSEHIVISDDDDDAAEGDIRDGKTNASVSSASVDPAASVFAAFGGGEIQVDETHQAQTAPVQPKRKRSKDHGCHDEEVSGSLSSSVFDWESTFGEGEVSSCDLQNGGADGEMVKVGNYQVKEKYAVILRAIMKKHGDIGKDFKTSSIMLRSFALEGICEIFQGLRIPLKQLTSGSLEKYTSFVKEAALMGVNVEWLEQQLREISETIDVIKKCKVLRDAAKMKKEKLENLQKEYGL